MKKILSLLLISAFISISSAACAAVGGKLSVVVTIFPEYDWVKNILGSRADDADVTLLLKNGIDMHSYQPTVDDIITMSKCDLFIYVGGESDAWVEKALSNAVNKDMTVLKLLDVLGDAARHDELLEGMEAEEHEHSGHDDHDRDDGPEYDEHVWLSLRNASILCGAVKDALSALKPEDADAYAENLAEYRKKLNALDAEYRTAVESAKLRTILFGDRFPFRYLAADYGLKCYAAFPGCSAETEASFETIAFLAQKTDELELPAVLTLEGTQHRIAETVVSASASKSAAILAMDSMQSVTLDDAEKGADYISIMERNLDVLKTALGKGGR